MISGLMGPQASPLMAMMAMRQGLGANPMDAPSQPAAANPNGKIDPMTWLMISGALAQGAQPGAGGLATAAPGIAQAFMHQKEQREGDKRSDAQQRALALMQIGDMKGAIRVLGSAKGLEGEAVGLAGRMADRDHAEARDERLYRRDRADYKGDLADERAYEGETWRERYDITRAHDVEDRDHAAALTRETAEGAQPNWKQLKDENGNIVWGIPGTNVVVDSGVNAPGAETRSLLGAETTGRAVAGIPGAKEANARMARMEAGGSDADGNEVKPYTPGSDWGARWIDSVPGPGFNTIAAWVGGENFRDYKQAFAQFESAMMPIMSGAAVTESEAARLMNAVKPQLGDGSETLKSKAAQRERMVGALDLALRGDREALNAMIEHSYDGEDPSTDTPAGPVQISSPADYEALAPGAPYIGPDGRLRRKAG